MTRAVDPEELFTPIAATYERASSLLSLGLEGGWRRRLVERAAPREGDLYLDVATGTGLVARELRRRNCQVIGVDLTAGMLAAADRTDGIRFVQGRAERLPFPDASFDGLTFTYLLRYVDDPTATMRELARVVRPGGRIAMLEFFRPRPLPLRVGWWLFTRLALPVLGSLVSRDWRAIGRFLGRSIDAFYDRHSIETVWRGAGIEDVRTEELFLGSAVVAYGRAGGGAESARARPGTSAAGPAFYALPSGGWRDYVTLLHPPYTAWHLSYVALGAALAPTLQLDRLAWTLLAFFLALGIGVHALDELNGRPLRTRIPAAVLRAFAVAGLGGAVVLGIAGTTVVGPGLLAFMAVGLVLALSYPLELARGRLHSDLWFALGWGAFPVLTAAWVGGGITVAALAGAAYAVALSYAQRALSTWVRMLRRRADDVAGEIRLSDGQRMSLDSARLIAAPETALRWLTVVAVLVPLALVALRFG